MPSRWRGWLLDLYDDETDGLRLWFITEDDARVCLRQPLDVVFYASGESAQLRSLWVTLRRYPEVLSLARETRRDAFIPEPVTVLKVTVDSPRHQTRIFREIVQRYPRLVYYDADLSSNIRHAARYGTFPMAFCEVEQDEAGNVLSLRVLNSRWDLAPVHPVFRVLTLEPDCDPGRGEPSALRLQYGRRKQTLSLQPADELIQRLNQVLQREDPDFVLTSWGDTWLIPTLMELAKTSGEKLLLNRDEQREVAWQKEMSYFSYGQIVFRPEEAHLFGRCHIDQKSAMMWRDYGLDGAGIRAGNDAADRKCSPRFAGFRYFRDADAHRPGAGYPCAMAQAAGGGLQGRYGSYPAGPRRVDLPTACRAARQCCPG
jgi:DNA polymerase-2